jgi:16S rRNA (uracil1498-N3)-methyltransferase
VSLRPFVLVDGPIAGLASGARIELSDADRRHLGTVLRLRAGAALEVADGQGGRAAARLEEGRVALTTAPVVQEPLAPRLVLAQALPKGRKLDEVVRQVTELGVDAIVPLEAARCVARLEGASKRAAARERWEAVARAAAAQARRSRVPEVLAPVPAAAIEQLLTDLGPGTTLLVAHPGGDGPRHLVAGISGEVGASVVVAIGPEGGWTPEELATFGRVGGRQLGLGPSVLRTEHAGAAALAALAALVGRFG